MSKPTFESVRLASRNGRNKLDNVIKGRVISLRTSRSRSRALMDFDLFSGKHNLKLKPIQSIQDKYSQYLKAENLNPTKHANVTPTVVRLQVRLQHAQEWFSFVYKTCVNLENLQRIRVEQLSGKARYLLPSNLVSVIEEVRDGQVIKADKEEFTRFIQHLSIDYEILLRMSPRDFERAIAAVYSRTGRFDRVILTPASGDEGRDIVLESSRWGSKRMVVELKRYRRNKISAEAVNALIGVLTGEEVGSRAAFITTSTFAPRLSQHRSIRKAIDNHSLELLNLVELVEGCIQCEYSKEPLHFGAC